MLNVHNNLYLFKLNKYVLRLIFMIIYEKYTIKIDDILIIYFFY